MQKFTKKLLVATMIATSPLVYAAGVPTRIEITSSGGEFIQNGSPTTIGATLYDDDNNVMDESQITLAYEGNGTADLSDNIFTPTRGGERLIVSAKYEADDVILNEILTIRSYDINDYYVYGAEIIETDGVDGYNNVERLFDGTSAFDDVRDDNSNYAWVRDKAADAETPHSLTLKLTAPIDIDLIRFFWRAPAYYFAVSVSNDGTEYTKIGEGSANDGQTSQWYNFGTDIKDIQYIQIDTKGWVMNWGLQLGEIKIYGDYDKPELTSIILSSSEGPFLEKGKSTTLSAKALDQYGFDFTPFSEDDIVFTMDGKDGETLENRVYKSEEGGRKTTITATYGNVKGSIVLYSYDLDHYYDLGGSVLETTGVEEDLLKNNDDRWLFNGNKEWDNRGSGEWAFLQDKKKGDDDEYSMVVKLNSIVNVELMRMFWVAPAKQLHVSVSSNGKDFTPIGSYEITTDNDVTNQWYNFGVYDNSIRYIKINTKGRSSGWGLKLGEIKIYGLPDVSIPTSVEVTSSNGSALASGETSILTANVYDQYGNLIENLEGFEWNTSDFQYTDSEILTYEEWKDLSDSEFELLPNQALLTASEEVAGKEGLSIWADYDFDLTKIENKFNHTDEELKGTASNKSNPLVITGFSFNHYLFDQNIKDDKGEFVHDGYQNIDFRQKAAESVVITSSFPPVSEQNVKNLFSGGPKEETDGGMYRIIEQGAPADATSEIIVSFYDPVDLEAVILLWETAAPSSYKVEVDNDYTNEDGWYLLGEYSEVEKVDQYSTFSHRFGIRFKDHEEKPEPVSRVKITTYGNNFPLWGLQLADIKAYGKYADINPEKMTLDPYVNVDYKTTKGGEKVTLTHDHPNTVVFFEATTNVEEPTGGQFEKEFVYPNPKLYSKYGAEFHLRHPERITYNVVPAEGAHFGPDVKDNYGVPVVWFDKAGEYTITATYSGPVDKETEDGEGYETIENGKLVEETDVQAVHHNAMITWQLIGCYVYLIDEETRERDHELQQREVLTLMTGRTAEDGGVDGSANLCPHPKGDGKKYEAIVDLGHVLDISAVELYWEGACPKSYDVTFSREIDENYRFTGAHSTHTIDYADRRAVIDRPRFDRFAVNIDGYEGSDSTDPEEIGFYNRPMKAESDSENLVYPVPEVGSTTAIRYITIHNVELDPWMGDVWGAKLAEITPYYDPEKITSQLPTGITDIEGSDDINAPVYYFNLQGHQVLNPEPGQIVIRRQGSKATKILVR